MKTQICERMQCTGCGACAAICPAKAIQIDYDGDGFLYPSVTPDVCVECGRCNMVCPQNKAVISVNSGRPQVWACWLEDVEETLKSTSGGAFFALANYVINRRGVVYGAAYDAQNRKVKHTSARTTEELKVLRGTKYIQSETEDCYEDVKRALQSDLWVLFSGCPCQIASLYGYLGKTGYKKLITAEVICHGVASTKFFRDYLLELEGRYNQQITGYCFRDKTGGWEKKQIRIQFQDGSHKIVNANRDAFMNCYYHRAIYRESCYQCRYAVIPRIADFTLGDYFNVPCSVVGRKPQRSGISLMMLNNEKASALFQEIRPEMVCYERPLSEAIESNANLISPSKRFPFRDAILHGASAVELSKRYCAPQKSVLLKAKIKWVLHKHFR